MLLLLSRVDFFFLFCAEASKDPLMGAAEEVLISRLTAIKILSTFYDTFVNSTKNNIHIH